jgi:hypothetical protein
MIEHVFGCFQRYEEKLEFSKRNFIDAVLFFSSVTQISKESSQVAAIQLFYVPS